MLACTVGNSYLIICAIKCDWLPQLNPVVRRYDTNDLRCDYSEHWGGTKVSIVLMVWFWYLGLGLWFETTLSEISKSFRNSEILFFGKWWASPRASPNGCPTKGAKMWPIHCFLWQTCTRIEGFQIKGVPRIWVGAHQLIAMKPGNWQFAARNVSILIRKLRL